MMNQTLPLAGGAALLLAAALTGCASRDKALPLEASAREEQRSALLGKHSFHRDRFDAGMLGLLAGFIGTSIPGPRLWRASYGGSGRGLPPVLGGVGSPGSWGARRGTGRQPSDSLPADNSPFAPRSALHAGAEPSLRRCGPRRAGGAGEIERLCPVCGCDRVCA